MIEERNRPVNQTTSTSSSTLPNRIVFHSDCFSTNRKNNAFYTKKELATAHVLTALSQTVPLARTMAEKITAQREWAIGRARNASVVRST